MVAKCPSCRRTRCCFLRDYPWPGNVRELANVLPARCCGTVRRRCRLGQLRTYLPHDWPHSDVQLRIGTTLYDAEKRFILASYHALGQNKQLTATQLWDHQATLYQKLRRYEAGKRRRPKKPIQRY